MKVLHINCVYPVGSTGKITAEIHHALLNEKQDSFVLYSRGKKCAEKNAKRICSAFASKINHLVSRISGLAYGGCFWQTYKIIDLIKKEKPDIVHLQCINGYFVNVYKLITFLKKSKIPTVLTLHADFMFTANCGCAFECEKWKTACGNCPRRFKATESLFIDRTHESFERMKKAFEGFEKLNIIGVSEWLSKRAKESPIMEKYEIKTIYNGIDTNVFSIGNGENIRKELDIGEDEKMILWVTSGYTEAKGKDFFHSLTEKVDDKKFRFVVAGTEKPENYSGKAVFCGKISDQKRLADYYAAADVTICCSKQESFPTVFIESQCCGTPVVGFDVGGVSETIFEGMGETVPFGDLYEMKKSVEKWTEKKKIISADVKNNCIRFYSSKRMADEYIKLYRELLSN